MEVNVVEDAVCGELGGHVLESGAAAALAADVSNGDGGVHAEKGAAISKLCGEGLDVEESREKFQCVDVLCLSGGPVVLCVRGVMYGVEDATGCQVGSVDVQGDGGKSGMNRAMSLGDGEGGEKRKVFAGQGSEGDGFARAPLDAGQGGEKGPGEEASCIECRGEGVHKAK